MTPHLLHQLRQQSLYDHFTMPRPYSRTIDLERLLKLNGVDYLCLWEVTVKQWTNDGPMPEIEWMGQVEVYDPANHAVTDKAILAQLNALAVDYSGDKLDEIIDEIERKENQ